MYVWVNVIPDAGPNGVHPQEEVKPYRELIEELRDRVRSPEDANRENRRIIAALTSRIPAIEAPADERETPETVEEASEGASGQSATEERQEGTQRRPWWRRVLGRRS